MWLCLHFHVLFENFIATPSSATGTEEKEKFEIEKESAWLQFWIWKIIFIPHDRRRWWWWWHGIGEMWKWGSEINKFCKNFFVLTLDHRWAAATGSSLYCSSLFFMAHTKEASKLLFLLRESKPVNKKRRQGTKKKVFFSLMTPKKKVFWAFAHHFLIITNIFLMCHDEVPNVYWTSMEF